jgi:hypothetical protein
MGPSTAATQQSKYFTRVDDGIKGTKGKFCCTFCNWTRTMTSASSAVSHLIGGSNDVPVCDKVPEAVRQVVRLAMDPSRAGAAAAAAIQQTATGSKRQAYIDYFFGRSDDEAADLAVAMLFYECGIPFNVLRSEAWRLMLEKVRAAGKGWKWPDYNQVRGPMLDKAERVVADLVRAWDAWDPHACACSACAARSCEVIIHSAF